MPNKSDIQWFKENFHQEIEDAVAGTVFDLDMLTAVACQETGELWQAMRKKPLTRDEIVARCCGDTLDSDRGRSAFPKTKADLVAWPEGQQMFDIARAALLEMAKYVPGYAFANTNKKKFCHGFGVFQYDLQFFKESPSYFLEKKYEKFENSLDRALVELKRCLKKVGLENKASITDREFASVAIAYNTGGYDPAKGLKQGHKAGDKFYGELIADYLALSRTVALVGAAPHAPEPGAAPVPAPAPTEAAGPLFRVHTMTTTLRLRSEATISTPLAKNVITELPDGHVVRSITGKPKNGFIEVETALGGTLFGGFASGKYLVASDAPGAAAAVEPAAPPAARRFPAVEMPRAAGSVTKRTRNADAHSLNEPNMPGRTATDAAGLCRELGAIIAYLAPNKAAHKRYQPRAGLTFCNIYTHDYCTLAGVYLPRVWWTAPALVKLSHGQAVKPLYGDTITEMRANDLFRWLRDFGQNHGWRQAVSADEVQLHANRGGVALIVARRKEDGRSGHMVAVVPETGAHKAKRNAALVVTSPLQSQAGATNFSYGTSTPDWWKAVRFAESAFWLHA